MKTGFRVLFTLLVIAVAIGSPRAMAADRKSPIEISELMASNRSTIQAQDGSFPDWVELYNPSS